VEPGWRAIYGAISEEDGDKELQALPANTPTFCAEIEQQEHQTKPPPRFNEATLLSAMENSGKLVEDEELAEAMKERGLGTPATRAAIIEKLINEKYIVREQRELVPTGKAFELLSLLEARKIDVLASPELTGEWEYKLNQIISGAMTRSQFMQEIREITGTIVDKVKKGGGEERHEASFSPIDGVRFYETASAFESEDKKLVIRKVLGGRIMEPAEIVELIKGKTLGPFSDFRSKKGKPFSASIHLANSKVEFLFADSTDELDLDEIRRQPPLGISPTDQTKVFETPAGFLSESALEGDQKKGLRISKMILGRRLDREHISQLLNSGRTELITGFISKKKKPFDAFLLLDGKGKLGFEFPPRKKKGAAKQEDND
jgi:DNA topoisomerase-3